MDRKQILGKLADSSRTYDFAVIGGGATGLGIAVDAASRGYSVVMLEQHDFTKATSSRSTKLVHGGVRYLAQGDVGLVVEALRERGILKDNAPHLVKDQRFIIGAYRWWEKWFYTIGLTLYDVLAGKRGFGRSLPMSVKKVEQEIPHIQRKGLRGGIVYHDGQFDDSRLAINLMQTAVDKGAIVLNYVKVTGLLKDAAGKVSGVTAIDQLGDGKYTVKARSVINATGIFVDEILRMDDPTAADIVRPSQGVHLIVDKSFLGSDSAIMIPKTSDGRVLFVVPWHDKVILGTTDTPLEEFVLEPRALPEEIEFILKTAGEYLDRQPTREDVLCVYAGLRPLAAPKPGTDPTKTKELSRSHKVIVSESNLVTITGGKWTTYRDMAEDTIDKAIEVTGIEKKKCVTRNLHIHGYKKNVDRSNFRYVYGSDEDNILAMEKEDPKLARRLHPRLQNTVSEVLWAVRREQAHTVEDVLARRFRALFLDARAAMDMAPDVARIMAAELGRDQKWVEEQVKAFNEDALGYLLVPYTPQSPREEDGKR
ncbi:MAG: glycerol-3-phosphate dehydrogenase/oxidase [Rikenellaceae bacterium]|nr:glycerol-3-phosphate dehydrogenase/oxidase [Rikenellaceae bacterium]